MYSTGYTFHFLLGESVHLPPSHPGENYPGPRAPSVPPRAVKGWALALLQLLGAQGGENQRQAMWAPAFISQLQRGANKPCPHARRCSSSLLTAPACPSPSSLPSQKEDRAQILVPGHSEAPDCWPSKQCPAGAAVLARGHCGAKGRSARGVAVGEEGD